MFYPNLGSMFKFLYTRRAVVQPLFPELEPLVVVVEYLRRHLGSHVGGGDKVGAVVADEALERPGNEKNNLFLAFCCGGIIASALPFLLD